MNNGPLARPFTCTTEIRQTSMTPSDQRRSIRGWSLHRRSTCALMALAMAVASLGLAAGPQPKSTAAPAIAGAVPVNRPDVPGGYESSFVLIRIKPDAQVVKRSDGLWTIQRRELAPDSPDLDASAIAAALQRHRV